MSPLPPVIAIDGPTASGKGTIAQRVADRLGFHYLDSGALYRLLAWKAVRCGIDPGDETGLARIAAGLQPRFRDGLIELDGIDVTDAIRTEDVSRAASQVAVHPAVRAALLALQRRSRMAPGLVADGRDMGTVVFPDASLKVFLTASVAARAERRHKQLIEKGISTNISSLSRDLEARDRRDAERSAAPLRPAEDAYQLDSSALTIDEVVDQVLNWYGGQHGSSK
ncbi:MAG TPA: (d)CMP kinase [Burkholderiaceae bacterium]|nr:(d)CMP kinase [Burkholderiaceae bacterium]HQR71656.1 (d)CMP kinase [Burkholderiaceae bacterium]